MTVAAIAPSIDYVEDGVTLNFAVPFRYLGAELAVTRILADGTAVVLPYGVAWSATAAPTDAGGTLTLVASIAGSELRIRRATARRQATDYATGDTFPAESHEAALDRAMLIDQEQDVAIADTAARALLVPVGELVDLVPALADRIGKFLGFDADGNPVALTGTGADAALRTDLASIIGASLVAFLAAGGGAIARSVQAKLRDFPTPQDIGLALEPTSLGIGAEVLRVVTTGEKNTGFGYHALQSNTDGIENTAFGYRALSGAVGGVDPNGDFNTAFGSFALASMTIGFKNAAFGRASADNLTSGSQNLAAGYGSMHWATTAQNCVAAGFEALHGGAVGPVIAVGSVGVGFHALYECLSGDYNAAVGTSALAFLTTGDRNTAVGTNALNAQTTASDCVGVGYGAGLTNSGNGNIFIGAGADANAGLANVTVIGSTMTATLNNTLLLGNGQTVIPGTTAADFGSQANPWNFGIFANSVYAMRNTAMPAGGANGKGLLLSSTANFGVFFGSGAPTLSAAKGSLYLRSDGGATNNRAYINTDGGTTWTALTTAA